jgi:hypothetical protein
MFSFTEFRGQASYHQTGTITVNEHYYTRVKPGWLIGLKLLGLTAMIAVAYALALPSLRGMLPMWQMVMLIAGVMLIYVGIAFFVRPEPNGDNMGIVGGLCNDPFQYSDNINRWLWQLHCTLGPGRFAAETLLDVCVYFGLAGGEEVVEASEFPDSLDLDEGEESSSPVNLETTLAPDRFARR